MPLLLETWRWPRWLLAARWALLIALARTRSGYARTLLTLVALFLAQRDYRNHTLTATARRVVITGAGNGLGKAAALRLLRMGDTVAALDMSKDALAELDKEWAAECAESQSRSSGKLVTATVNVTKPESVAAAASQVDAALGGADAVVNFAGIIAGGPLVELEDGKVSAVLDVNVKGTVLVGKYFFPLLQKAGPGSRLVLISSEVGYARLATGFNAPYAMSKFAVEAIAVAFSQELGSLGVNTVVLNPGAMKTPLMKNQQTGGSNDWFTVAAEREGTLFRKQLLKGAVVAQGYMQRNAQDPSLVADAVVQAVHSASPRRRYVVGMSAEMIGAMMVPQCVLDFAVAKL
eukprot:TRINITY_DN4183_c0_g1_i1.p1 TRINITY_DN4183_c0_g1~~TRINITY_DN4183_c0_g1_i1.p1  ORF type:complete len:348 (+),score=62.94 TRINITY_DN4183_c0_g1_i1:67-1110(+)